MTSTCRTTKTPILSFSGKFEDEDGGVCYIETHDHDTYSGHFRLRLIRFTPTRFAFAIARKDNKYVEVTYNSGAQRFDEVPHCSHHFWRAKLRRSHRARPCRQLVEADHRDALGLVESVSPPGLATGRPPDGQASGSGSILRLD
jgi:hypothetical protein